MEFLPVSLRITWVSPKAGVPSLQEQHTAQGSSHGKYKGSRPRVTTPITISISLYLSLLFLSLCLPSFSPSLFFFPTSFQAPSFSLSINPTFPSTCIHITRLKRISRNAFQLPDTRGTQMEGSGYPAVEQLGGEIDK